MIPPDVASALRLQLPDQAKIVAEQPQNQPLAATQRIVDVLRDLQPGQRIMAEVQAMLPNGTYRAVVAQREIALALPFSAKAGDMLELEAVESDGQVTLAVVANQGKSAGNGGVPNESVTTALSQTGRMIGQLLGSIDEHGKRTAAPLNGNQPLVENFPKHAPDLAPVLRDALTKSGVFYEAHQAKWVAGQLPTDALKQEPQGKIPSSFVAADETKASSSGSARNQAESSDINSPLKLSAPLQRSEASTSANTIPHELTPIVQQQLDALATQNYAWQGQIWPKQTMWWEISDSQKRTANGTEDEARWRSRIKLNLPNLGEIDAIINLQIDSGITLNVTASSPTGEALLTDQLVTLQGQLEAIGLQLKQAQIRHGEIPD